MARLPSGVRPERVPGSFDELVKLLASVKRGEAAGLMIGDVMPWVLRRLDANGGEWGVAWWDMQGKHVTLDAHDVWMDYVRNAVVGARKRMSNVRMLVGPERRMLELSNRSIESHVNESAPERVPFGTNHKLAMEWLKGMVAEQEAAVLYVGDHPRIGFFRWPATTSVEIEQFRLLELYEDESEPMAFFKVSIRSLAQRLVGRVEVARKNGKNVRIRTMPIPEMEREMRLRRVDETKLASPMIPREHRSVREAFVARQMPGFSFTRDQSRDIHRTCEGLAKAAAGLGVAPSDAAPKLPKNIHRVAASFMDLEDEEVRAAIMACARLVAEQLPNDRDLPQVARDGIEAMALFLDMPSHHIRLLLAAARDMAPPKRRKIDEARITHGNVIRAVNAVGYSPDHTLDTLVHGISERLGISEGMAATAFRRTLDRFFKLFWDDTRSPDHGKERYIASEFGVTYQDISRFRTTLLGYVSTGVVESRVNEARISHAAVIHAMCMDRTILRWHSDDAGFVASVARRLGLDEGMARTAIHRTLAHMRELELQDQGVHHVARELGCTPGQVLTARGIAADLATRGVRFD
jgi:hypothetical protein